ncbi:MAG: anion permease [Pseudomonadota bacterium]|nr:anion permease [Pseudomonadota bacterium]
MAVLRSPGRLFVILILLLAAAVTLWQPMGLTALQSRTTAIVMVTLALWATGTLPEYLTSLLFFLAAVLLQVAQPVAIFAGFSSTAFWLIFSGMVIGMAIRSTGLGHRIAGFLGQHLDRSYAHLIGGLVLVCTLLGFIMPSSMGRTIMMVPVGLALAERCGFLPGSRGRTGVALAVAMACHIPTFTILPSNIPNMVLIGAAENIYDQHFSYTHYLLLHFPLLGMIKAAVIAVLITLLFADRPQPAEQRPADDETFSSGEQKKLLMVLLVALGFWLTDTLHGISPAWVGLAAAVFLLLPKIGLVEHKQFNQQINVSLLLFIAGVLGVGTVVNQTGLGQILAGTLEHWLPMEEGRDALNFFSLVAMSFFTGMLTTLPGVPAVLTPMAGDLAQLTGLSVATVLMTQVIGFSTILFPYQSGPLLVGMQLFNEPVKHLLRILWPLAAITLLVLVPLDYLWWQLLGMF